MNKQFKRLLEEDIRKITSIFLDEIKNKNYSDQVISIALTGSFSREEGSYYKLKNKWLPYGDYDFLIVTEKPLKKSFLESLEKKVYEQEFYRNKINNEIKIDISNCTLKSINKLTPDLSSYDLKESHKVLYGSNIKKYFSITQKDIPIISPFRILFNRINVLLIPLKKEHLKNKFSEYDSFNFQKLIDKVYIDISTALTLKINKYSSSYKKRLKVLKQVNKDFEKLYLLIPDLKDNMIESINRKLNPGIRRNKKLTIKRILKTISDAIFVTQFILNNKTNNDFEKYADDLLEQLPKKYYSRYLSYMLRTRNKFLLKILSKLAGAYENIYVRTQLGNIKKVFQNPVSPIIHCIVNSIYFYCFLKEKNEENKKILEKKINDINLLYFDKTKKGFDQKYLLNKLWNTYTRRGVKRSISNIPTEIINIIKKKK